jgi:hypothetical protein
MVVVAALVANGCGGEHAGEKPQAADKHEHEHGDAHEHPSEGPHHGRLIELGEDEYHGELVPDPVTRMTKIYILDGTAKKQEPIDAKEITLNLVVDGQSHQFKFTEQPDQSDPIGRASRFVSTSEQLDDALKSPETTGRLNVDIAGKSYVGKLESHK